MAEPPAKTAQSAHAADVGEKGKGFSGCSVVQRQGLLKKGIIAAGKKQPAAVRRQGRSRGRCVDHVEFQPFLDEAFWEQPFAGHFGRRQSFVIDQRIDHFFVDLEQVGHLFGGNEFWISHCCFVLPD